MLQAAIFAPFAGIPSAYCELPRSQSVNNDLVDADQIIDDQQPIPICLSNYLKPPNCRNVVDELLRELRPQPDHHAGFDPQAEGQKSVMLVDDKVGDDNLLAALRPCRPPTTPQACFDLHANNLFSALAEDDGDRESNQTGLRKVHIDRANNPNDKHSKQAET